MVILAQNVGLKYCFCDFYVKKYKNSPLKVLVGLDGVHNVHFLKPRFKGLWPMSVLGGPPQKAVKVGHGGTNFRY